MDDVYQLRNLDVACQVELDDNLLYIVDEQHVWLLSDLWFADHRDDDAKFYGAVEAAKQGKEVVLLDDGSDTYVIASMANVNTLENFTSLTIAELTNDN